MLVFCSHRSPLLRVLVGAVLMSFAPSAWATPTITGDIELVSLPLDLSLDQYESEEKIRLMLESTAVTLAAPLQVDRVSVGTVDDAGDIEAATLPAGTVIRESWLVHYDRTGNPTNPLVLAGSLVFDGPILGVIFTGAFYGSNSLGASDGVLGQATTLYATESLRGIEFPQTFGVLDTFTISADRRTLDLSLTNRTVLDELRVLVGADEAAVPEPAAAVLVLAAGLLLTQRRRRA
jgi:hypothetical protein